jgi:hypothetical protein
MDFRGRLTTPITRLQRQLGVSSYSWFYGVIAGYNTPSVPLAKRIETATNGLIRWTEFFEPGQEFINGGEPTPQAGLLLEQVDDVAGLVHAEHEPQDHPAHRRTSKTEAA